MKREVIKQKADPKLLRTDRLLRGLILLMTITVLYDAFIHKPPLYYVLFFFAGLFVGRIFSLTQRIEPEKEDGKLSVSSNRFHIILVLFMLAFRFLFGKTWLEHIHVVWAADALYLFFIGVYRARWKNLVRQIDGLAYRWVSKNLPKKYKDGP